MLTIFGLSEQPCFICQKKEHTAEVKFKNGTFTGVLCKEHIFERLTKPEKKTPAARK